MPGRNEKRPCGSGKKYKNCCLRKQQRQQEKANFELEKKMAETLIKNPVSRKNKKVMAFLAAIGALDA